MINLIAGKFEEYITHQRFDLIFLDPPDNEGRKYENYNDNLKNDVYITLLKHWILKSCTMCDGPVFISFATKWTPIIENLVSEEEVNLIQRLYWRYTFGQSNKTRYTPSIRPIYWLNRDIIYPENIKVPSARQEKYGDKRAATGGKMPDNVWDFPRICGTFKEKRKFHCTQHPEALLERIILGHSKVGDSILDPFVGSGTTAIVCKKLKRNCIGIDCSKYYIEKIREIIHE